MIFKTKLIILRTIRYGETSLIVTAFTELFGVQTYMINGIRTAKKAGSKASLYQPGAILDATVYHNTQKNMQRIKEADWAVLYKHIFSDVIKNNIALFMVELIYKTLKQPEENIPLFQYCEDALAALNDAGSKVAANFPLYFTLHLAGFFGFALNNLPQELYGKNDVFLDFQAGCFTHAQPQHFYFLQGEDAIITAELLNTMQPHELEEIRLNQMKRRGLLLSYMDYFALHIQDFGQMKTLAVLNEVL